MLAGVGCGWELDDGRYDGAPGTMRIVSATPETNSSEVGTEISIDLCFSSTLDPRSLDDFDALISSGNAIFDTDYELQLFPYRPPGSRIGVDDGDADLCPGSVLSARPANRLRPGTTYRLRLRATAGGWAGEALETKGPGWVEEGDGEENSDLRYTVEFRTRDGDDFEQPLPEDPPISLADLFEPGEVFDPARGSCSCHLVNGDEAQARLDLRSPSRAFESLVLNERIFDTGFTMVAPGRPSDSYLIQKLVHTGDGGSLHRVQGAPMPPWGPLDPADRGRIAQWIAGGALP